MPLLETVKQMQQQGMQDTEIAQKMQEQGYNPKEIDDAINQGRIKAAVSEPYEQNGQEAVMSNSPNLEMQPSVMSPEPNQPPQPQPQEYIYPVEQQQQYQPQYAGEYSPPQTGISPETISEIAEQIVTEKFSEIKKLIGNIADFKTVTEAKISNMDSRLKKIESTIEKLQSSIIGRVGEFGQAVEDIKGEMSMMQDSFSKVVNQAVSNNPKVSEREIPQETREEQHQETQHQETQHQEESHNPDEEMRESVMKNENRNTPRSSKKSKDGFENFLR